MSFDFIVVGGGTAGCVLAARLSADPRHRVLLLDAGTEPRSPWLRVPGGVMHLMGNPKFDWDYRSAPDPSRRDAPIRWAAGRVVGGGSAINGMVFNRGLASDYDDWAALGCEGWGAAAVTPYFQRMERYLGPAHPARGRAGPQPVEPNRVRFPGLPPFLAACANAGFQTLEDVNVFAGEGVGQTQTSTRRGLRVSTREAYLAPARHRANLEVLTDALAVRLLIEAGRCTGVEFRRGGELRTAHARRELVVSAGAFGSPKLLLLSGIGPGADLGRLGIPVVVDLPAVGANLHDHPAAVVSAAVTIDTIRARDLTLRRRALHGLRWVLWREGPAAGGPILATGYLRGDPSLGVPDLHLQFTALGYRRNARNQVALGEEPAVTTIINVCKPEARGRITLSSPDPLAPFDGRLQLLGSERDVACLVRGLRVVRRIHCAAPLASVMREEFLPGPECTSDAQLESYCRESVSGQYHPVGTCRMGADGASVVDPVLRVRGLAGLRVADASVMPTITSANTMAPVMMIAEKAADLVLGPAAST